MSLILSLASRNVAPLLIPLVMSVWSERTELVHYFHVRHYVLKDKFSLL